MVRLALLVCCFLATALIFNQVNAVGTLYIDQVVGNRNSNQVYVENVLFSSASMHVDSINSNINGGYVQIQNTYFSQGNVHVAANSDFVVDDFITQSDFRVQGGLSILKSDGSVAFSLANNTGNLYLSGNIEIGLGFNAADGAFDVNANTLDVTVSGPLFIYSDLSVGDNFHVSAVDGSTQTNGYVRVGANGVQLGTDAPESVYIEKFSGSVPSLGQPLNIYAQDGSNDGGSIVLRPGFASSTRIAQLPGSVLFGRDFPDDLIIGRATITTSDASSTIFTGQSAGLNGGDVFISAGSGGIGGSLFLSAGCSPLGCGKIYLGANNNQDFQASDLTVGRPVLRSGLDASSTSIIGQTNTGSGAGGDLYLNAGDGTTGAAIRIRSANILLSDSTPLSLTIGRKSTNSEAGNGWTVIRGADSLQSNGGSLSVRAGDASVSSNANGSGGSLNLCPGSDPNGVGIILFGSPNDPLIVGRPDAPVGFDAKSTTIQGSAGLLSGGLLQFQSGSGVFNSGDILLAAGSSVNSDGGSILVTSSNIEHYFDPENSPTQGNSIFVNAKSSSQIFITGGSGLVGGNLVFSGGLAINGNPDGSNNGHVQFSSNSIIFDSTNVELNQDSLAKATITLIDPTTSNRLTLSTNAQLDAGVVQLTYLNASLNERLLRGRQPTFIDQPLTQPWQNQQQAAAEAVRIYNRILLALASHGLVDISFIERPVGPFQGFSLE